MEYREVLNSLFYKIASVLKRAGLCSRGASLLGLFFAIAAFYSFYVNAVVLAALFIFLCGLMDGVKKQLARIRKEEASFWVFLGSVLDRYSDGVIVFGTATYLDLYAPYIFAVSPYVLAMAAIMGLVIVSYIKARAGRERIFIDTIVARPEMLFIMAIFTLAEQVFIGLLALCALANLTALYGVYQARMKMA